MLEYDRTSLAMCPFPPPLIMADLHLVFAATFSGVFVKYHDMRVAFARYL